MTEREKPLDLPVSQRLKLGLGRITGRLVTVTERSGMEHTGNLSIDPKLVKTQFFSKGDKRFYGSGDRVIITNADQNSLESD